MNTKTQGEAQHRSAQSPTNTSQQQQQQKVLVKSTVSALNKQPKMIGPYQVGEVIGRGACGKVFKGLNFQTGQLVAIKQVKINNFKEEQKRSIQMEINLLKKLEHPNIVKYIDSIYSDHYLNIILEFVENGSLDSLIKKFGQFPETLVAIYVQQVLQGLDYLHSQVVIHRDIKGANILTTKDGIVKLADFGVATKINETEKSHSAVGTPYWMAPEVIEMSGQVTSACDIWSLGCTVLELLTANPPYSNLQPIPAMIKIVQEGMQPLPDSITSELKDFLMKCFEKDPFRRIDAKGLLEHQWLKKYDKNLFQKIINNGNKLPEVVSNTIKLHINQVDKPYNSMYQQQMVKSEYQIERSQQRKENINNKKRIEEEQSKQIEKQMPKDLERKEEDDDGEIGDFGEEINDMNDVPIERPKCLSNINFNSNHKKTAQQSEKPPSSKPRKIEVSINRDNQNSNVATDYRLNTTQQFESNQNPGEEFKEGYSLISMKFHSKQRSIQNLKSETMQNQSSCQEILQPQKNFQQVSLRAGHQNTSQQIQNLSISNPPLIHQFNSQTSQRNYKSQDKSAGPGSGDGIIALSSNISQTPQSQYLMSQSSKQVFDVQGNRKVYYLTKKNKLGQIQQQNDIQHSNANSGSGGNINDESQLSLSLSLNSRQKRVEMTKIKNQSQQHLNEEQELMYQKQQYQQQQRELMARYHLYSNQNSQHQITNPPFQLYQKSKSNEIIRCQNSPSGQLTIQQHQQQQTQQQKHLILKNQQQQQYHQHHQTQAYQSQTNNINNNNNIQNAASNNFNFKFQHDPSQAQQQQQQQEQYELQNPQFIGRQNLPSSYNINPNFEKKNDFQQEIYENHDSNDQYIKYTQWQNSDDMEDFCLVQQESEPVFSNLPYQRHHQMFGGHSADLNLQQQQQQQQLRQEPSSANMLHQRYGSSFSQMNAQSNNIEQQQNMLQYQYSYPLQSIEDHIKKTQLSEQKLGRAHLTQFYGGNNNVSVNYHIQHKSAMSNLHISKNSNTNANTTNVPSNFHVQHKSVISNFQGSTSSPKNNYPYMQGGAIYQTNLNQNKKAAATMGINGSFENYFDTASNNDENYLINFNNATMRGSMLNMQNLKNVRESYSKKLAEEGRVNEEKKIGMMMMLAIGPNEQNQEQVNMHSAGAINNGAYGSRGNQIIDQPMRNNFYSNNNNNNNINTNNNPSLQQMQSIGSGRSNNSVQLSYKLDQTMIVQIQEECQKLINSIKKIQQKIENLKNDKNQEVNLDMYQPTELTEENQDQDIDKSINILEQELKQHLFDLNSLILEIGYQTLMALLNQIDDIAYPTLLLINTFCEKQSQIQEQVFLCGIMPFMIKFSNSFNRREVILEVGYLIAQIIQSQSTALLMFISGGGFQILSNFLDHNYEENKDMIILAIDAFFVFSHGQAESITLPQDDLIVLLSQYQVVEKIAFIIPKLIQDIETSTVLTQQEQVENYLEKAFDILQKMMAGPELVVRRLGSEKVMKNNLQKMILDTINDSSPLTLTIMKRFIKILQLATQTPQIYNDIERNDGIKLFVEMLQFFMNDIQHIQLQMIYDTLKLINVLCKLSPERTEQAAQAQLLEQIDELFNYLQSKIDSMSKSKRARLLKVIISIIQEFIVASDFTRKSLYEYQIHTTILSILTQQFKNQQTSKDQTINGKILDSFALWIQTDNSQIESFLAKRETLETFFKLYLQNPRTKVMLQVFNAINRLVSLNPLIARSLASNVNLIERLIQQLQQLDQMITQADENAKQGKAYHHNKNSISARSINNVQNVIDNQFNATDNQSNNINNSKISQNAQIIKELMEIFLAINQSSDYIIKTLEKYNYIRIIQKIFKTSEKHNFVILQQIAQNILIQNKEYIQKKQESQVQRATIQDQSQILPPQMAVKYQQQIIRQNTEKSSSQNRAKSPLFQ